MTKEAIRSDSLTLSRYIKSCENLKQLKICDNILWNFCKKYKVKPSLFDIFTIGFDLCHPSLYQTLSCELIDQYDAKETNLLNLSQ